ncbi:lytic transglycosylase domain-containing protein [Phenylobacterium sp. VNQ135]|uniref:lytic transglycosylase domain-containing protein n=1 Tax=Phenylobacterium sp. VNQ135 TaxID=3400922 RepID=UPI003C0F2BE9
MRRIRVCGFSAAVTSCALLVAGPAAAGGSGMPWEGPLQQIVESGYRPAAVSPVGAAGLTQLMPGTADDLGVRDRFDPQENLLGGADYLARQIRRFGDLRLALAAYNAGPGRVGRLGRVPEIAETRAYVEAVVDCYLALTAGRGVRSARQCQAGGRAP